MRSVKELKDIICDSRLAVRGDGDGGSSSAEGRVKGYDCGNNACTNDKAIDDRKLCTQPQDFISQLEATFPLRDWPGVIIKNILLPYVGRNEPPPLGKQTRSVFHYCFESSLAIKKGSLEEIFTCTDTTVMDSLQIAKGALKIFRIWCFIGERFMHFAHSWLLERPSNWKVNWPLSERGILKDELSFACGLDAGKSWPRNLSGILSFRLCVLPTHPLKTSRSFCVS